MYSYQGRGGRRPRCAGRTATGTLGTRAGTVLYSTVCIRTRQGIYQTSFDHVKVCPTPFFGVTKFVTQFTYVSRSPGA